MEPLRAVAAGTLSPKRDYSLIEGHVSQACSLDARPNAGVLHVEGVRWCHGLEQAAPVRSTR